jgi:hypothetical protein
MKKLNVPVQMQVEGQFELQVRCAKSGKVKRKVKFNNLILDTGLSRLAALSQWTYPFLNTTYLGTGTTPPAVTDVTLQAYSKLSSAQQSGSPAAISGAGYVGCTWRWRYAAGNATGNWTEVGVGWGTSSPVNNLFSRELIRDTSGNPVTLTVLSNEFLDVIYTFRVYYPTTDVTGTFTLGPTTYSYTARAAETGAWVFKTGGEYFFPPALRTVYGGPCTLGPITGSITGHTSSASIGTAINQLTGPVGTTGYKVTVAFTTSTGNVTGGITAMFFDASNITRQVFLGARFQMVISPAIPKTSDIEMTMTFTSTWARRP